MRPFMRERDKDRDKDSKRKGRKAPLMLKKRHCRFCADSKITIDYKDAKLLTPVISERGTHVPRRISGNCSTHQREVTLAVKRARVVALLPFTAAQQKGASF